MTVFGDLDVTVLDELPPGRTPVVTRLVPGLRRQEVFARMRRLLDEGRQAYVVCPLVTESDKLEAAAAESEALELSAGELSDYRVGMHPRPAPDRRAAGTDAAVSPGRDRRAGGDHGDRGGRGRAQRHRDGGRSAPTCSAWPSSISCAAGWGGDRSRASASWSADPDHRRCPGPAGGDGAHHRRLRAGRGRPRAARRGKRAGRPSERPARPAPCAPAA